MRWILETPRLALRELEPDDLDATAELLGHPEVMRFWPRPYTRAEAAEWIARQRARYAADGYGYWLAVERASGAPVGQAGLLALEINGVTEGSHGYILHRDHWGRGYATELAAAICDYAFTAAGLTTLATIIRPENEPSRRVAERLGMRIEGSCVRAELEHLIYRLDRPEWHGLPPRAAQ